MKFRGSYLNYVVVYFFYFFVMGSFGSIMSLYLKNIGKTAWEISIIASASAIFAFVMVPVFGYFGDRTGKRRLLSCCALFIAGCLSIVFSFSSAVWLLFILNGLTLALISCVMQMCERMAASSKFRYGYIRVIGTVGYAVSVQVAGLTFGYLPPRYLFYFVFAACIISIAGFAALGADVDTDLGNTDRSIFHFKGMSKAFSDRNFVIYLFSALLLAGVSGTNMTYSPLLLSSVGISTSGVGTIISLSTLIEIPLILFSNRFMDRFSCKALLRLNFILMIFQFLCYSLVSERIFIIMIIICVKAIASTLFVMINLKIVRNIIDPSLTTTALGICSSFNSIGIISIQNLSGIVTDASSLRTMYFMLAVIAVGGIILSSFLKITKNEKVFT